MPQKPLRHKPDANAVVYVRIPGWAKNACLDASRTAGMTLNSWAASVLRQAAHITSHETTHHTTQHDTTQHTTHDTPHDTPTLIDTLNSWMTGTPIIAPCGKPWPCPASQHTNQAAGHHYCTDCGVRVTRPGQTYPNETAPPTPPTTD